MADTPDTPKLNPDGVRKLSLWLIAMITLFGLLVAYSLWDARQDRHRLAMQDQIRDRADQQIMCQSIIEVRAGNVAQANSIAEAVLDLPDVSLETSEWITNWRNQEIRRLMDGVAPSCEAFGMSYAQYRRVLINTVNEQTRRFPTVGPEDG